MLRDPRWGRNVESPGEDPYLNGQYGKAYTLGLQATDDEAEEGVVQSIVTIKHWLAYSIEDYGGFTRKNINVNVSAYDLASTYMPAWEAVVREGKALGIMCR